MEIATTENTLEGREAKVKAVVWDLDNTIWNGVLLEDANVQLREGIREVIEVLDRRGILHAIASKNEMAEAWAKLEEFGLQEFFLYPEINWGPKSDSLGRIVENLNIGKDTVIFIDDQVFERDEVKSEHPEIDVLDAIYYRELTSYSCMNPPFVTEDSARRRMMYKQEKYRATAEKSFKGPKEVFLKSLEMVFSISEAKETDLQRAEELTVRTNQLNATGQTYSYEELLHFATSADYKLYVCELVDKYGSYGKIGLGLVHIRPTCWHLKLMLMSCRVLSRSVGSVFMTFIMNQARKEKKALLADFRQTERNRMMYATYKFASFEEISNDGAGNIIFENKLVDLPEYPPYIEVLVN